MAMWRRVGLAGLALSALMGIWVLAYGVEKTEFVAKCVTNGRPFKACACTYNALADLPDAYADLAVSWAHEPVSDYQTTYLKTVIKDVLPFGGERRTSYGRKAPERENSYWRSVIKSIGQSVAVKWAVSLIPGVDGGTSIVVTTATKATGKFGYARYVFDQHCDKRLETMANELTRLRITATDATMRTIDEVGKSIGESVDKLTSSAGDAAKSTLDALGRSIGLDDSANK